MQKLIDDVFDIIKDYREDEGLMSKDRIKTWISQFAKGDREFILEEMRYILKQRYISKKRAKSLVKEYIIFLTETYKYKSPKDFLLDSHFIDHQPKGKSQKVLLSFLDKIIQKEFSVGLADCQSKNAKFYIYFDDVLCTGDTLVKGLTKNEPDDKGWFFQECEEDKTNLQRFKENKATLVLAYFCIHKLNTKKAESRIYYGLGKQNVKTMNVWDTDYEVENDIDNIDSKLNFIFPREIVRDKLVIECQNQIEEKIKNAGYHEKETIRYREINKPKEETFFSSPENRDRFEKIILDKCIEVYNTSEHLKNTIRPKPLGYGLYTDLSFGFGALIFTWRNVPFNVPIVFWYKSQHWTSLFERKFVNYEH